MFSGLHIKIITTDIFWYQWIHKINIRVFRHTLVVEMEFN
jgi:hypothetical protein